MILVDVYMPSIDDSYDFMLDENVSVEQVIVEISEMIAKKVTGKARTNKGDFLMCSMEQNQMLDRKRTLYENGIRDGCRLMMV